MLLASSITPSGALWAESAARKAMPTAHVVDLGDFSDHPLVGEFSESFSVTGASRGERLTLLARRHRCGGRP